MRRGISHLVLVAISYLVVGNMHAQLSPGDLTRYHAHLEGVMNCTKCHDLGDKVSNNKCLDCHKELKVRIDQRKGYHVSSEVAGKDCFACHSEHHGRSFEIVRFDEDAFNHAKTGYTLTGAHLRQDCKACHTDEHIASAEIKKKEYTYLGLSTSCTSCHTDVHQNTLSTNCASCHTTDAFKPAPLFDHSKTEFPLKGKHKQVDCRSCHTVTFENGALYQRFSGVAHNTCASCHSDPHAGSFGTKCSECHNEESFTSISGSKFNHAQTGFPLRGKHKQVDCRECHQLDGNVNASSVFQDFKGKDFNNCALCHNDVHEAKFGVDCKQCHTEESFNKLLNAANFNHALTGFELRGKHAGVDCRKCHESRMTDPLPHMMCMDCHEDFHEGQFAHMGSGNDCASCHTESGFEGSTFTMERHDQSAFPLTGAHLATPCFACHLDENRWVFNDLGTSCNECHTNVHNGVLSAEFYPGYDCTTCHTTDRWASVDFDHTQTDFALQGGHASIQCIACHKQDEQGATRKVVALTAVDANCTSCHSDVHEGQFMLQGQTDCRKCHDFAAWLPTQFDHNTARFKLEGAHQRLDCKVCHINEERDGKAYTIYKLDKLDCIDCHM